MAVGLRKRYIFGDFEIEPGSRRVVVGDAPVHLTKKPFGVLLYLIEHRERIVSRQELLENFWDGHEVYEESLTKCVGSIRKALNDSFDNPRYIETRWSEGYRFVGEVKESTEEIVRAHDRDEASPTNGKVTDLSESQSEERLDNAPVDRVHNRSSRRYIAIFATLAIVVFGVAALTFFTGLTRSGSATTSSVRSIAVMPIQNLSGDPSDEYLSEGLTESLVNALSKIDGLKIVSSGSAKGTKSEADPTSVGRQLGVDAVLTGGLQKNGDSVRLAVQLVNAADGAVLWVGDQNQHAINDIFAVQDNIAFSVADQLKIKLSTETGREISRRYTDNAEAYQLYLKGRFFWNKRTKDGLTKGIEYFQQAIDVDPNYALAYAGIADCYDMLNDYGLLPTDESVSMARAAALKAIEIDDKLAEPHCTLGDIETHHDWNWQDAENEFKTGIGLDPKYATCHHWYALHLAYRGLFDKSLQEINIAQQLEPLSLGINANLGRILFFSRQYDQAIQQHNATIDMDQNFWSAHFKLAEVLETIGHGQEAIEEYAKSSELEGDKDLADLLRKTSSKSGYKGAIKAWLNNTYMRSKQSHVSPYQFALLYVALEDTDKALDWLEKAADERSAWIVFIKVDPRFDALRGTERFQVLLRRIGFGQ